ncbi:MAG TPA: response regulator transcription factor [Nocardioides sp.]|uniref:response regulator transcription factor n=1 Tax=Nocardioides sp. TaxID=35761 RepID=UPI002E33D7B9|nr:response regulator transcription factor [Nocardioides sp.]HEX5087616.1 response regulator transcription factor [Nocardioides sp.]
MAGPLLRVAVYSPQEIVRQGLVSILARRPDVVRVVPLPTRPEHPDPDVVLYDVMALLEGDTRALGYLVEMTTAKVLAVGRDLRPDLLGKALDAGADGFFSIGADGEELLAAVASAGTDWQEGDTGPNPIVGSADSAVRASRLGADLGLSPRELEVVSLIARGMSNQEIAETCFLSINSVKTYIRTAYRKIGVENRANAVGWAIRHGFATDSPDAATR